MSGSAVARSYAEALFALGEKHGLQEEFAAAMGAIAEVLEKEPQVARFLESPRIDAAAKREALGRALRDRVPPLIVRFLDVVIRKDRTRALPAIAREYRALLDEAAGRVEVRVTLAREPDEALEREIASELSRHFGKTVIPHVTVDPSVLGGIVVRYGDRLYDGSLRRRIAMLRRRLLAADVRETIATAARGEAAPGA